ncbi:hypothetical protein M0Q50_04415 [bacterium]|jgi:hypothetical protein|nr:hypothetical protein [bacterium]
MPNKLTINDFIDICNIIHNNKYDYSKSIYVSSKTKLIIICPIHGEFEQTPDTHKLSGCGCPKCDPTNTLGNDKFIEKSIKIHGYKYDYSNVYYVKNDIKVDIMCKEHGIFSQKPGAHLRGQGCPNCYSLNKKSNTKDFIEKSIKIHNNTYDYSLVNYVTKKDNVTIICPIHGKFEQKASIHLQGHGCKICRNSKLELYFRNKLETNNIDFISDYRFDDCRNILPLPFDFYLQKLNILIECDGIQHRESIKHFGGDERLKYQKKNDTIKNNYCIKNNILLYRLKSFSDIDEFLKNL